MRSAPTDRLRRDLLGCHDGGPVDHDQASSGEDRDGVGIHRHEVTQRIRDAVLEAPTDHRAHAGPESVDRV